MVETYRGIDGIGVGAVYSSYGAGTLDAGVCLACLAEARPTRFCLHPVPSTDQVRKLFAVLRAQKGLTNNA